VTREVNYRSLHRLPNRYSDLLPGSRPKKRKLRADVAEWAKDNLTSHRFFWSKSHGCFYLDSSNENITLFIIRYP
jgi:hypothetical protein